MYRKPPAPAKPPKAMGGHPQPHLNLAPPKPTPAPRPQHATAQIQHHVDHFAEAPARHAKALKRLGVNQQTIHHIAQESRGTNPRVASGRAPVRQASGFANIHNFTGSKLVDKTLGELGQAGLYAIPGAAIAAQHPIRAAKATYHGIGEDIHHPLRHPGYTLLDAWAAASLGGGAAARGASALSALRAGEGLGRAATRKGIEGGSLLHAPEPGTVSLKAGEATVHKPLSRNAVYRQAQKARYRTKQAQLEGRQPSPGPRPERTFAHRLSTERRMEHAAQLGDPEYVRRLSKGLSRGEHTAIRVAAVEGKAALKNPDAVIERQIATHQAHITSGEDKAAHQSIIRDLRLARDVLKNPSHHFLDALEATRETARHTERESIARGFLSEKGAQTRLNKIAAAYGTKPDEQSFYFHAGLPAKKNAVGRVFNPRPSEYGLAPPQAGRYVAGEFKKFRGLGIKHGRVPLNISKQVSQTAARRITLHSAHDFYHTLRDASTPTRETMHQIPIRAGSKIEGDLKKYFQNVEENIHASPDELRRMTADDVERLKQELQAKEFAGSHIGADLTDKGVRWVDKRYIRDLGGGAGNDYFGRALDAVTNPIRISTLYLRPAYALNALGNAGMLATEGHLAPGAMWRAARAQRLYGKRNTAFIDTLMGHGRALGQTVPTGAFHKGAEKLAEGWNVATDLHARRAALLVELKRAGMASPEAIDKLRSDPALAAKRNEITERARAIIGDYENLGPVEKQAVRRLIYFYPWLKVATKWTGHQLTEHPVKTAILANNGRVEAEHAKKVLGMLPQWARLSGLIPVGKSRKGLVNTINPASVNTPATDVQAAASLYGGARAIAGLPKHGTAGLGDLLTPGAQTFVTAAGQSEPGGRPTGLPGAIEQTPIPSALRRMGIGGKPSKTYPGKGLGPGLGPLVAGGLYPRATSKTQLNKASAKELRAGMSPPERVNHDYKQFHAAVTQATHAVGAKTGATSADVQRALKFTHGRLALRYERAAARAKIGGRVTSQQAYTADLDVLVKHGWVKPARAAELRAWVKTAPKSDVSTALRYLTYHYFDQGHELTSTVKYLREHGHPGLKLPTLP